MRIGVTIHATDVAMDPAELAREAEARGFYSLYIPEHTHIPTSRKTPPPTGDEVLADEYKRSPDPYVALAAAAAVTQRIRLGTGIGLPAQHDPITLAKQIATLDRIANGRFVFGVGFGWNRDEIEQHGVDFRNRRKHVREVMLAMQALWANEVAEFHGDIVDFSPSWQWPKPVQQPRPRVLIGGSPGPKLLSHIAEYADGWMPIGGAGMKQALTLLGEALAARGRGLDEMHIVPMGILPTAEKLDHYRELGVTESVLRLPSAPRDQVLPILDNFTHHLS